MSIDSTFRPNNVPALKSVPYTSDGIWNASHFTADLTDPLTRVCSHFNSILCKFLTHGIILLRDPIVFLIKTRFTLFPQETTT